MATMRAGRYSLWLGIAAVVTGLDQLTKHLASTNLDLYRPAEVTSWFNLTLAHNTGAAFSFLAGGTGWQRWFLALVAATISISLLIWLWRLPQRARILPSAIALVLGGRSEERRVGKEGGARRGRAGCKEEAGRCD